ncbi:MAG: Ig-like domain-containing protein, partial [Chloroflexi bacterium]|nr:Ig-like domain-containing protein [Chloroflexota bacterium]
MAVLTLVTGSTLAPRPAPAAGLPATVVLGWSPGVTRDVPLSGPLTVYFNRVMDPTSVERAWRLSPAVAGTFSASENAVTFTPATPLRPGSSYRLT